MEERAKILLACLDTVDQGGRYLTFFLSLTEEWLKRGKTVIFAHPVDSPYRDSYLHRGFDGLIIEHFSSSDGATALSALCEKHRPDLLFTCLFPIEQVEKTARQNPQVRIVSYLSPFDLPIFARDVEKAYTDLRSFLSQMITLNPIRLISPSPVIRPGMQNAAFLPLGLPDSPEIPDDTFRRDERDRLRIGQEDIVVETFWDPPTGTDPVTVIRAVDLLRKNARLPLKLLLVCPERQLESAAVTIAGMNLTEDISAFLRYYPWKFGDFSSHIVADLAVSSAAKEAFPNTALEMLSLAKPAIAANIQGTTLLLRYSGFSVYDPGDEYMLAKAIYSAVTYPKDLSDEAFGIRLRYSAEKCQEGMLAYIEK